MPPGVWASWFADPAGANFTLLDGTALVDLGENLTAVPDDYCANPRDDGANDLGAVEYDGDTTCDTAQPGGGWRWLFGDGFETGDGSAWSRTVP